MIIFYILSLGTSYPPYIDDIPGHLICRVRAANEGGKDDQKESTDDHPNLKRFLDALQVRVLGFLFGAMN